MPGFFFMKLSIVIPLFNEELNIKNLFYEIIDLITSHNHIYKFELILINDCSSDQTLKVINKIKDENNFDILIINNKKNIGQSLSLIKGIKSSKYDNIISIDGDGQNNPKDLKKLIKVYKTENIDLVGGIRVKRVDSFLKKISSKIANKIRMTILNDDCKDTGCSLKIFKKEVFNQFPEFDGIHRFLPALYKGYNYKTKFLPVDHRKREFGKSNYGTIDRLFKGIKDIIKVRKIIIKFKNKKHV